MMIKHTPFLRGADTMRPLVTRTLTFILDAAMCVPAKNMMQGMSCWCGLQCTRSTLKPTYTKHLHLHYTICHMP